MMEKKYLGIVSDNGTQIALKGALHESPKQQRWKMSLSLQGCTWTVEVRNSFVATQCDRKGCWQCSG